MKEQEQKRTEKLNEEALSLNQQLVHLRENGYEEGLEAEIARRIEEQDKHIHEDHQEIEVGSTTTHFQPPSTPRGGVWPLLPLIWFVFRVKLFVVCIEPSANRVLQLGGEDSGTIERRERILEAQVRYAAAPAAAVATRLLLLLLRGRLPH